MDGRFGYRVFIHYCMIVYCYNRQIEEKFHRRESRGLLDPRLTFKFWDKVQIRNASLVIHQSAF
jgi:hypothetical protein